MNSSSSADSQPKHLLPAVLASHRFIAALSVAIGVTAFVLVIASRSSDEPASGSIDAPSALSSSHGQAPAVQTMVERLATRLQADPDNGTGWIMLARSYAALGRFADAADAFRKGMALLPADADLVSDYADVLAITQAGSFQGEPHRLIRKALELDPRHPKALALAGNEAFRSGDFREALGYWNKVLEFVPGDSELAVSVRGVMAVAQNRIDNDAKQSAR